MGYEYIKKLTHIPQHNSIQTIVDRLYYSIRFTHT